MKNLKLIALSLSVALVMSLSFSSIAEPFFDAEYEFGLAIKLVSDYQKSDLAGVWFNIGLDTPENGGQQINSPLISLDKKYIDAEGRMTSATESKKEVLLDNSEGFTAFMSQNKDVIVYSQADGSGEQHFGIFLKQAAAPSLNNLQGSWKFHIADLAKTGDFAAQSYHPEMPALIIDNKGIITNDPKGRKIMLNHDGSFSLQSVDENSVDKEETWAINENNDIIVGVYTANPNQQSYIIGIKSLFE